MGQGRVVTVFGGRNRRLLFRSYLWLVGGLLAVAIALDFGFGYLQTGAQQDDKQWLESTFRLLVARLEDAPASEHVALAAELSGELGIGVHLLDRDEVQMNTDGGDQPLSLVDADGNVSYLHTAESVDAIIRLGPIVAPKENALLDLLPPVFYLSIFAVVGLWLRPLLRDVNVISDGAQRFAADYRDPPSTAEHTTELTLLAQNLDEMAEKLSGVLRSQKELIAALSHEMRTPLARIRFALAVIDDKAEATLRQKLRAINDDVQEIDDLVSSMLDYARLDHPDIRMNWQSVPLESWLYKILEKTPDDTIRTEVKQGDAVDTFRMDPRLMELALSNLIVNAAKYAEQRVLVTSAQEGQENVLAVDDDGQGVPVGERDAVFKAFTRLDDSRSRETGGYGLGLAIVARVAELHGGSACVDTSPTLGGARFTLRWPLE